MILLSRAVCRNCGNRAVRTGGIDAQIQNSSLRHSGEGYYAVFGSSSRTGWCSRGHGFMKSFVLFFSVLAALSGVAMAQSNYVVVPTPNAYNQVLSDDKKTLYVGTDGQLFVIDVQSGQVVTTVPIGYKDGITIRPNRMAYSAKLGLIISLVVVENCTSSCPGNVGHDVTQVLDLNTWQSRWISLSSAGAAIAKDGTVYLATNSTLTKLDPDTFQTTTVWTNTKYGIQWLTTGDGMTFLLSLIDDYQGLFLATFDGTNVTTPQIMDSTYSHPSTWDPEPRDCPNLR